MAGKGTISISFRITEGANGLIVANSTQDYLVAALSGGSFTIEAHAG